MWFRLVRSGLSFSLAGLCNSGRVPSLSLLVVLASARLSEGVHAINLVLGAHPAEVMDLADGAVHALLDLLKGEAEEAFSAHDLRLLSDCILGAIVQRSLPLGDADEHVLLGLVHGEDSGALTALNIVDDLLGRWHVQAEDASEDVLAVEGG